MTCDNYFCKWYEPPSTCKLGMVDYNSSTKVCCRFDFKEPEIFTPIPIIDVEEKLEVKNDR